MDVDTPIGARSSISGGRNLSERRNHNQVVRNIQKEIKEILVFQFFRLKYI